jgi:DNA-binding NtrC family response regulator
MQTEAQSEKIRVLLVDDEKSFLEATSKALNVRGCDIAVASSAMDAMVELESRFFDVVVLDLRMPGMDGLELMRKLNAERPTQKVVIVTGHATVSTAVEAMKLGAFEFLLKPVRIDDLLRVVQRGAELGNLERQNIALVEELERQRGSDKIVGESQAIKSVKEFIDDAAASSLPVLITGESGTGKELVARAIHAKSNRSGNQLVIVDGSTLREELIASELFGHEKGAFTGAVTKKAGLFEIADRGCIFLDEIAELSASNQAALLRVIEYGTFRPIGSLREVHTNVRIIAATNQDTKRLVSEGKFREDLFYRLAGLVIKIPSLRERKEDIPLLTDFFLSRHNISNASVVKISNEARDALLGYSWPGNVRELLYVIERAALLGRKEGVITASLVPGAENIEENAAPAKTDESYLSDKPTLAELSNRYEKAYIGKLLEEFTGNKSEVARVLGISRSVLYDKLRKLGLE